MATVYIKRPCSPEEKARLIELVSPFPLYNQHFKTDSSEVLAKFENVSDEFVNYLATLPGVSFITEDQFNDDLPNYPS
jgi:hypothetical protein